MMPPFCSILTHQLWIKTKNLHAFDQSLQVQLQANGLSMANQNGFKKAVSVSEGTVFGIETNGIPSRNLAIVPVTFLNWHSLCLSNHTTQVIETTFVEFEVILLKL